MFEFKTNTAANDVIYKCTDRTHFSDKFLKPYLLLFYRLCQALINIRVPYLFPSIPEYFIGVKYNCFTGLILKPNLKSKLIVWYLWLIHFGTLKKSFLCGNKSLLTFRCKHGRCIIHGSFSFSKVVILNIFFAHSEIQLYSYMNITYCFSSQKKCLCNLTI